jgi:squalene-hopene/tetraprenyl-beta-curcumene cyclase
MREFILVARNPIVVVFIASFFLSMKTTAAQNTVSKKQTERQVHDVIQRSLPFIEDGGQKWIANKKCVTCHQVPHMVWALNAADSKGFRLDQKGFRLDQKGLEFANEWSTTWINLTNIKCREGAKKNETLLAENDAIAALILGRAYGSGDQEKSKWIKEYRDALIESQQEDGAWEPRGQLPNQKRPLEETKEVSSMWALLAIASVPSELEADAEPVASARRWLEGEREAKSTEWWATRLMIERELGNDKEADRFRSKLIEKQNDDGGWGWLCSDKSDAFGTGIAIYALVRDGVDSQNEIIANAINHLASTQNEDGSWSVNGTKEASKNRFAKTSNYWGTCWAAIGLLETMPIKGAEPASADEKKRWRVSGSE